MGKLKQAMIDKEELFNEENREEYYSLLNIAQIKGFDFAQEYDPHSGTVKDRLGFTYLKEGYIEGFLAGFNFRFTGEE